MFFRRSKLRCLLSLDPVEVLSLIQHNLYLLSFSVPLRIANLHNYPESYALSLESGFSSVNSSVVFKHSSAAAAVTLSRRMTLSPSTNRVVFLVDAIGTFVHEFVFFMNLSSCRISVYLFTNSSLLRVHTLLPVNSPFEVLTLTCTKPIIHFRPRVCHSATSSKLH